MQTTQHYSTTYGLPASLVEHFCTLSPGEATRVINALAGNHVATTKAELLRQLDIIQAEVKEGYVNLADDTLAGLRDDAMDIVFTGYGLANRLGAQSDIDYADVVFSNLFKFDVCEEDANKTRDKYLSIGVVTTLLKSEYLGHTFYVTKVAYEQIGNDGKKYPSGKWLKSYKWVDCQYVGTPLSPVLNPQFNVEALNLYQQQLLKQYLVNQAALLSTMAPAGIAIMGDEAWTHLTDVISKAVDSVTETEGESETSVSSASESTTSSTTE